MNDPLELINQATIICDAAQQGPWTADEYANGHDYLGRHIESDATRGTMTAIASRVDPVDATFIATARTLIPNLTRTLKMYHHWHKRASELQGPEPGRTPSMVYSWIVNLKRERDEARAELGRLKGES